jgi:hypothetical protein
MIIGIAAALILVLAPLLLGLCGVVRAHRVPQRDKILPRWDWQLTATSALLYALAFNLTFFLQELFLVLPKAALPGVTVTLFHNNHTWLGDHPLTHLFHGTGALATFACGLLCARWLRRRPPARRSLRLFVVWMVYNGLLQSLPQVLVGALNPANDVGMAMEYLGLPQWLKDAAALIALVAIAVVALRLVPWLLGLADSTAQLASCRARSGFMFSVATVPGLVAIALIVPFRVPRGLIEVLLVPCVVTFIGIVWLQCAAWRVRGIVPDPAPTPVAPLYPLALLAGQLLVFQLLLRPGIQL